MCVVRVGPSTLSEGVLLWVNVESKRKPAWSSRFKRRMCDPSERLHLVSGLNLRLNPFLGLWYLMFATPL